MKKVIIFILIAATLLSLCACSGEKQKTNPKVDTYIQSAQSLYEKGELSAAILLLEQAYEETNSPAIAASLEQMRKTQAEQATEETTEQTTEAPTEETTAAPIVPNVVDAYSSDSAKIPEIELPHESITALNREIYDTLYAGVRNNGYGCRYSWYVNDDILSLAVEQLGDSWNSHLIYNVSVSTGELLMNADILEILGWDEATYLAKARPSLASFFDEFNAWSSESAIYWDVRDSSVSDANVLSAQLYFGEGGILMGAVKMGCFAGSGETNVLFPIPVNADEIYSNVALTRPAAADPVTIYLIDHPIVGEAYCLDPNNPDEGFTDLPSYLEQNGITDYEIVDMTAPQSSFNIFDYLGVWTSGDLTITVERYGILIYGISTSGGDRVAEVEADLQHGQVVDGYVSFPFEDSWGNTGTMHLSFCGDYIYAYVTDFVHSEYAMWGFYETEFTLYRE